MLALDTATEACSVALWTGEAMLTRFEEPGRGHALRILPLVNEVLNEAGLRLDQLSALAAGIGPGAFTGVRIGVSVAQGLAFGAGLRVLPVNTLEALAMQALSRPSWPGCEVLSCLDARMGEVYWGCFRADAARGVATTDRPRVDKPEAACVAVFGRNLVGIGRGIPLLQAQGWSGTCDAQALPNAEHMVNVALLRLAQGEGLDAADLQPLYLRDKVAFTEAERAAGSR